MNIREGARRIQVVGRIFLAFSIAALVFIVIVSLIANFTTALHVFPFALAPLLVLFTFYPGLIGTACLTIGWIVEGFATPDIPAAPTSIGDEPPFPANSSIPPMAQ